MYVDVRQGYPPIVRSDRLGTSRSPLAAALLNLSGLGLGYAYLARPLRAGFTVAITVSLVAVAFATDAADRPWLWWVLAGVWLIGLAVDGWRLAGMVRRGRRRRSSGRRYGYRRRHPPRRRPCQSRPRRRGQRKRRRGLDPVPERRPSTAGAWSSFAAIAAGSAI